uniref:Uncharacterized protein n=1 Tax=Globodera rostochiensis TaxID=31243 RepID=A0A914H035_GLORO
MLSKRFLRPLCSVLLSALFSYGLAQALFTRQTLHWIYKIHQFWIARTLFLLLGDNEQKLQKMHSLWNPPEHPFPYLVHALFVYWSLRIMTNDMTRTNNEESITTSATIVPSLWRQFVAIALPNGLCVALSCTLLSLCAQRVGEMHSLVIALQLAHSSVTCTATAFAVVASEWRKGDGK